MYVYLFQHNCMSFDICYDNDLCRNCINGAVTVLSTGYSSTVQEYSNSITIFFKNHCGIQNLFLFFVSRSFYSKYVRTCRNTSNRLLFVTVQVLYRTTATGVSYLLCSEKLLGPIGLLVFSFHLFQFFTANSDVVAVLVWYGMVWYGTVLYQVQFISIILFAKRKYKYVVRQNVARIFIS